MEEGFVECTSTNSPKVDFLMVMEFIKSENTDGETAGSSKEER